MNRFEDISEIRYSGFNGRAVLLRLIESIGYRFGRATLGLGGEHLEAQPVPGGMSLRRQIVHTGHLLQSAQNVFTGRETPLEDWDVAGVLAGCDTLFRTVEAMSEAEIERCRTPVGGVLYLVNGPLSDALWHTGQISVYKKLLGISPSTGGFYKGGRA